MKTTKKAPAAKKTTKTTVRALGMDVVISKPKAPKSDAFATSTGRILDACAMPGCFEPPKAGFSYCEAHLAQAVPPAKAKAPARPVTLLEFTGRAARTRAAAKKEARSVKEELAVLIAGTPSVSMSTTCGARGCLNRPVAETPKGPRCAEHAAAPTKAPKAATKGDATKTIQALSAIGWTQKAIAAELGTSPGRVWFWAHGKPCSRLTELGALATKPVAKEEKAVSGSRKAPGAAKAARMSVKLSSLPDPRQLLLDLQDALNRYQARIGR